MAEQREAMISVPPSTDSSRLRIPRHIVQQRFRPARKEIPPTPAERNRLLQFIRHYVTEFNPVPPLPLDQLREHANRVIQLLKCDPLYREYIGVLINNEMWREPLAAVPYAKRLLLLPKCLRVENKCPAPFDEFGLLCRHCGLCSIQDLQREAEKLGYAVLVAEGSAVVMSLIQAGKIEAIVGVSCLSVLERAFPYMESAAIPGLAIPLLQDDCRDTTVDLDWVWDYIHLTSEDQTRRMDLGALRAEVEGWFTPELLVGVLGAPQGQTEQIAHDWLGRAGKRWRPFLAVATFQALRAEPQAVLPTDLRNLAVAVECFHKASLIHDDIEDGDAWRYGEKTLHEEYGLGVALNVGDLLIGEGYRLIGSCDLPATQKVQMLLAASQGQRQLCRGQGAELCWARQPAPLTSLQVLDIFRQKTAPAFEVALKLGVLYAEGSRPAPARGGSYQEIAPALRAYSEALGIAYQIRDDLGDYGEQGESDDILALRPGLLLAIAHERASGSQKEFFEALWRRTVPGKAIAVGQSEGALAVSRTVLGPEVMAQIGSLIGELKVDQRGRMLLETYKEEAIRSLRDVEVPNLKGLLRRVIGRIFNDPEIKGWCKEFEPRIPDAPVG